MKEILEDTLYSFGGDTVRVESGPQIIELDCTEENLKNEITASHYQVGGVDAHGVKIDPETMDKMHVVDWRCRFVSHVWKVYKMDESGRFIQVCEEADKESAFKIAEQLAGGMQ